MARASKLALWGAFTFLLASCGSNPVPDLESYGWCASIDFSQPQANLIIPVGTQTATGIQSADGTLSAIYTHSSIIEAAAIEAQFDIEYIGGASKTVVAEFDVFGIEQSAQTQISGSISTAIGATATVAGAGSNNASVVVVTDPDVTIMIRRMRVAGAGDSPFGTSLNCDEGNATSTPQPTGTPPIFNLPSATPSNTPTPSPTPTNTPTPTITPTPDTTPATCVSFDFTTTNGGWTLGFRNLGTWIIGEGWREQGNANFRAANIRYDLGAVRNISRVEYSFDLESLTSYLPYIGMKILGDSQVELSNLIAYAGTSQTHLYEPAVPYPSRYVELYQFSPQNAEGGDIVRLKSAEICSVPVTPTPSPTPTGTLTITPTHTPTPAQTSTSAPTPTITPTNTWEPDFTPSPYPTNTPLPTQTAYPTYTPFPTNTAGPLPTYTAYPTYTPLPASTNAGPQITATSSGTGTGGGTGSGGSGIGLDFGAGWGTIGNPLAIFGAVTNFFNRGWAWLQLGINLPTRFASVYNSTAAAALPGVPQCMTNPVGNNLCAIYYILENTIFAKLGVVIIPMMVVIVDLAIFMSVLKYVKAVLRWIEQVVSS